MGDSSARCTGNYGGRYLEASNVGIYAFVFPLSDHSVVYLCLFTAFLAFVLSSLPLSSDLQSEGS